MTEEQVKGTYRLVKTGLGEAWVLTTMGAIDAYPALLASGLPAFLECELPPLKALAPDERARQWARRIDALAGERALRAAAPLRTVYGDPS